MSEQEPWVELCRAAMKESDPDRLLKLTEEINRLLEEREKILRRKTLGPEFP